MKYLTIPVLIILFLFLLSFAAYAGDINEFEMFDWNGASNSGEVNFVVEEEFGFKVENVSTNGAVFEASVDFDTDGETKAGFSWKKNF